MAKKSRRPAKRMLSAGYDRLLGEVVSLLDAARRTSARAVNTVMTATYWEIGRRIVEVEQRGAAQAEYGEELVKRLAADLTRRFGRGFSWQNIYRMRSFFLAYEKFSTLSRKLEADETGSIRQTPSVEPRSTKEQPRSGQSFGGIPEPSAKFSTRLRKSDSHSLATVPAKSQPQYETAFAAIERLAKLFPLPWSHYVKLLAVRNENARGFYEAEALRGGWSVRQLDRQISSQFYERTLLSKNKASMLRKGAEPQPGDLVTPEDEIKDPFVLEFLNLKDEYSEHDLEEALIDRLEDFLLELGGDFTFVARQRRLRIGNEWYRIDLLFFHRRLRCLVVIDLKIGTFTHADAGQMHLYLNYAREHWTHDDENPPVGIILCAQKDEAVAHYSLEGLQNKVMAREYRLALPDEKVLVEQLEKTQRALEKRGILLPDGTKAVDKKKASKTSKRRQRRKKKS